MNLVSDLQIFTQNSADQLRPIRPPIELENSLLPYFPISILIIVAASSIWWYFSRNKNKNKIDLAEKPKSPPDQIALDRLRKLESDPFSCQKFYVNLSEIFRKYIADRFEIIALETTTENLLSQLKSTKIENEISPILEPCDLAKFAKKNFTKDQALIHLKMARDFIEMTNKLRVKN